MWEEKEQNSVDKTCFFFNNSDALMILNNVFVHLDHADIVLSLYYHVSYWIFECELKRQLYTCECDVHWSVILPILHCLHYWLFCPVNILIINILPGQS